ncbi:MAG: ERAP1-like C-terminal domain-containing protein [Vulcanimicrobiota bacterium]
MQIGPVLSLRSPFLSRPSVATTVSPDRAELQADLAKEFPDLRATLLKPGVAPTVAIEQARQAVESWVSNQVVPADPKHQHFWKGVAQWRATRAIDDLRPDWHTRAMENRQTAGTLWDIAEDPFTVTDSLVEDKWNLWPEFAEKKTCVLLDMVDNYLGADQVARAIDKFVAAQEGHSATPGDLFASLPGDWSKVMDGWLAQPHLPMVRSKLEPDGSLALSQEAFKLYPDSDGSYDQSWTIPVAIRYEDSQGLKTHRVMLSEPQARIELPAVGQVKWAYPNAGGKGVYRTDTQLCDQDFDKLENDERFAITANQWRLVRHGEVKVGTFLDLAVKMSKQADDSTLGLLNTEIDYLGRCRVNPQDREAFQALARTLLRPGLERLEAAGPALHRPRLAEQTTDLLALNGDQQALEQVKPGPFKAVLEGKAEALIGELETHPDKDRARELVVNLSNTAEPEVARRLVRVLADCPEDTAANAVWGLAFGVSEPNREAFMESLSQNWRELPAFESWLRVAAGWPARGHLRELAQAKNDAQALEFLDQEVFRNEIRYMDPVAGDLGAWLSGASASFSFFS